ncbi:hypothetical protein BGX27_008512 [Mortierella sp. AM989]|nr:hypothetical protein BGX27_008512 [Mortierella sp. AM989]
METKQRPPHSRIAPATKSSSHQPREEIEEISESIQIFTDAMQQAKVKLVRDRPPVFMCSTYEQSESAMELFSDFYKTVNGSPGPVGFDTETSTSFVSRHGTGVSLVQIATQDVCLMFQVFRITKNNTAPHLFPPRLKAFLEDPEQIKAGVASSGDAVALKQSYGIKCAGIVNLETIAKEKEILARSLASLDSMYGRPGREVIKTKSLLGWNWDREVLDPRWIWYAAKDAFAGVAIYENIMNGVLKKSHVPYEQQYPMTESEQANDIFEFLVQAVGGKGKRTTLGVLERFIIKDYPRFQKLYRPEERIHPSRKYVKMLLEGGQMSLSGGKSPRAFLTKADTVILSGRLLSRMLVTPEGVDILSPYFNGKRLDPSTLPVSGISPHDDDLFAADQVLADLRLFLELSWVWDHPRKAVSLLSIYASSRINAMNRKIIEDAKKKEMEEKNIECPVAAEQSLDKTLLPKATLSSEAATEFWMPFLDRLAHYGVIRYRNGIVEVNPLIEQKCLDSVPVPPPSPTLPPSPKCFRQASSIDSLPSTDSEKSLSSDVDPASTELIEPLETMPSDPEEIKQVEQVEQIEQKIEQKPEKTDS